MEQALGQGAHLSIEEAVVFVFLALSQPFGHGKRHISQESEQNVFSHSKCVALKFTENLATEVGKEEGSLSLKECSKCVLSSGMGPKFLCTGQFGSRQKRRSMVSGGGNVLPLCDLSAKVESYFSRGSVRRSRQEPGKEHQRDKYS